jgi:hypothetical protein
MNCYIKKHEDKIANKEPQLQQKAIANPEEALYTPL